MDGLELATLDTLQHGLARNAEQAHCLVHGEVARRLLIDKASAQILGNGDPAFPSSATLPMGISGRMYARGYRVPGFSPSPDSPGYQGELPGPAAHNGGA
jgi:hypothetical protein